VVFASVVRGRRKALGLTQEELAIRAGLRLKTVHQIDCGKVQDPHFSTLSAIARGLAISPSELVIEVEKRMEEDE
jgi:transcriptional regulator with XRE-family HTH domain